MNKLLRFLLLLFLFFVHLAMEVDSKQPIANVKNKVKQDVKGRTVYFIPQKLNFAGAVMFCGLFPATLATVKDQVDIDFMNAQLDGGAMTPLDLTTVQFIYIGGKFTGKKPGTGGLEPIFQWFDFAGTVVNNWGPGEPQNLLGPPVENCLALFRLNPGETWRVGDVTCDQSFPSICSEIPKSEIPT